MRKATHLDSGLIGRDQKPAGDIWGCFFEGGTHSWWLERDMSKHKQYLAGSRIVRQTHVAMGKLNEPRVH